MRRFCFLNIFFITFLLILVLPAFSSEIVGFFSLLDDMDRFLSSEVTPQRLEEFNHKKVIPVFQLEADDAKALNELVQELLNIEKEKEETLARRDSLISELARTFGVTQKESRFPSSFEEVQKKVGEVLSVEKKKTEEEIKKIDAAISAEEQDLNNLRRDLKTLEEKFPFVRFFLQSRIDNNTYQCIPLSGLGFYFVLFVEDPVEIASPDELIGDRGIFKRRLKFLDRLPFGTVLGGVVYRDVFTFLTPREESAFKKDKSNIETKMTEKERTITSLREKREELRRIIEEKQSTFDRLVREVEAASSEIENLEFRRIETVSKWVELVFRKGYELIIAPYRGNNLQSLLLDEIAETLKPKEVLVLLEERFLALSELLFTVVFIDPFPEESLVTLRFQDLLSQKEREFLQERAKRFPPLLSQSFTLEKYVFNKWQKLCTLPSPLFDVEVQVKYVPTKTLDEYRLESSYFPSFFFTIRYEHKQEEFTPVSPAETNELPPAEKEKVKIEKRLKEEITQVPFVTLHFPGKTSFGERVEALFEFSKAIREGELIVHIKGEENVEESFSLEGEKFSLFLRFFHPGVYTVDFIVKEEGKTTFEKTCSISVEKMILAVPLEEQEEGYLLRVDSAILKGLSLDGEKSLTTSVFGVKLRLGEEGLLTYPGALWVAREVALYCGLPPAYNEYLKKKEEGVSLIPSSLAQVSEDFLWVEGVYDYRGRPTDYRLTQLEEKPREQSTILQAKGVKKGEEKLFAINIEGATLLPGVIFIPREILQKIICIETKPEEVET